MYHVLSRTQCNVTIGDKIGNFVRILLCKQICTHETSKYCERAYRSSLGIDQKTKIPTWQNLKNRGSRKHLQSNHCDKCFRKNSISERLWELLDGPDIQCNYY